MGLKSTWWIADESEPTCSFCNNNGGCYECDPDYEDFYKGLNDDIPSGVGQRLRVVRLEPQEDQTPAP